MVPLSIACTDLLNLSLVQAMNDICHILAIKTVAGNVKNDFALKLLKIIGVDYAQGHGIAASVEDEPAIHVRSA